MNLKIYFSLNSTRSHSHYLFLSAVTKNSLCFWYKFELLSLQTKQLTHLSRVLAAVKLEQAQDVLRSRPMDLAPTNLAIIKYNDNPANQNWSLVSQNNMSSVKNFSGILSVVHNNMPIARKSAPPRNAIASLQFKYFLNIPKVYIFFKKQHKLDRHRIGN